MIYQAGAKAIIVTCAIGVLIYVGYIIKELIPKKRRYRRY